VRIVMTKYNIPESRIINADETPLALYLDQRSKIVSFKGEPRKRRQKEDRSSMTLLATIVSDGTIWKPLFVQKRKTLDEDFASNKVPRQALIEYAENGFILLLLDGHKSRENLEALMIARNSGLHIVVLPAKSTADIQPLDKAVFTPFKCNYLEMIAAVEKK